MPLIQFFKTKFSLSSEMLVLIDDSFAYEEHAKGSIFLEPDNLSKKLIFLEKGLYRTFHFIDNKQVTHYFWDKGTFNSPIESIFYDQKAPYGWEAIETCHVRSIDYKNFEKILAQSEDLNAYSRVYLADLISILQDRILGLLFRTAEERYAFFLKDFPKIAHRVPLGHLASYLGITQQTLSVIRAKK